jgi:RNA polymerase sigma-70 factor (ECF subfamily)
MDGAQFDLIVEKAVKGDMSAFEELCNEKYKLIFYYASRVMVNYHDAEDASQESILTLYKEIGRLRSVQAFDTWLYRIVTNVCYNMLRKKKKRDHDADLQEYIESLPESNVRFLPHERVIEDERSDILKAMIERLPGRRRHMVEMYYYDEKSYAEIATELGVTQATVASTLTRAKQTLRNEIEKLPDEINIDSRKAVSAAMMLLSPAAAGHSSHAGMFAGFRAVYLKFAHIAGVAGAKTVAAATTLIVTSTVVVSAGSVAIVDYVTTEEPSNVASAPAVTEEVSSRDDVAIAAAIPNVNADGVQINPARIKLNSDAELTDVSWSIISDASGELTDSGEGEIVEAPLKALRELKLYGKYILEFTYTNASGQGAVSEEFIIAE